MTVDAALASSESGRQVPVPLGGRSTASGVRPSVRVFPKNRCERAASGILSRHQKIFLQKRPSHKGYPVSGQKPFLDRLLGEGARVKSPKRKSPLPGGPARRNKLLVSWGPLVIAPALAGVKNQSEKSPLPGGPCPWGRHAPQQRKGAEQLSSLRCLAAGGRRRLSHCYNLTLCDKLSRKDAFLYSLGAYYDLPRPPKFRVGNPD